MGGGYLNDKCCPPNHGKCQPLPVPTVNMPSKDCAKMEPQCSRISEAACQKPCSLKGGHSCCSYRIGGCHSCCLNGYLNDKCCPPKHGKCIDPRRKDCAKMKPKCSRISEASCKKPCSLKGGPSCCSYRIGGCHSCCAGGYLNDKCCPPNHGKCQPLPVPTVNMPSKDCAKMEPQCSRISAASCQKPCSLKGGHSCCSYRIGGCHSCCLNGYLNDKCCPPKHGKCIDPRRKDCAKMK